MSLTFLVVGIGSGDPEQVTVQAINALNRADIVLVPRKGDLKQDLAELRREICRRYLTNAATRIVEFDLPKRDAAAAPYLDTVDTWHAAIANKYAVLLGEGLPDGGTVALLVWGDPSLYDSTLRILERLRADHNLAFEVEVIPGITSVQTLTAAHAIALNTIGGAVLVTTGRNLRDTGVPPGVDTVVVMLDGETSFTAVPPEDFTIHWGAYLGLAQQQLLAGRLADIAGIITEARAAARTANGWIMDVYILRRNQPS